MRQFTSISGLVAVQLTGADIPALLKRLGMHGITLFRVQQKDILTVLAWVRRKDVTKLMGVAEKLGTDVSVIHRSGFYWIWRSMIRRPVMLAGILLILLLSWFVPTRVLFITVEGNSTVPTNLILEKAAQCGRAYERHRRGPEQAAQLRPRFPERNKQIS